MTKRRRGTRKKSDPNQLSLLEYVPPALKSGRQSRAIVAPRALKLNRGSQIEGVAGTCVLTTQEAASYLKISLATLKSWRAKKTGPAFVRRGARLIGYLHADLDAYLRDQR